MVMPSSWRGLWIRSIDKNDLLVFGSIDALDTVPCGLGFRRNDGNFWLKNLFNSVLLPTLGRPMMATKPI